MHARTLVVIALLTLPSGLTAQRLPRVGRGTVAQPASLPPEIPAVARSLAYKRSRWSTEAYTLISNVQVPDAAGGITKSTTAGTGTRADYRVSEHFSATVDATVSFLGSGALMETAELGSRFSPMSWDRRLRPFFDVRAAFTHRSDTLSMSMQTVSQINLVNGQFSNVTRYSRGFGGGGGMGLEYSLTNTFALTSELSALRNRMTIYRLDSPTSIPAGSAYWMTSFRYSLGLKFNPVQSLHLSQTPRS